MKRPFITRPTLLRGQQLTNVINHLLVLGWSSKWLLASCWLGSNPPWSSRCCLALGSCQEMTFSDVFLKKFLKNHCIVQGSLDYPFRGNQSWCKCMVFFFLNNALFGLVSYNDPCYLSCKCIGDEVLPGPEVWWSWVYGCRPFCADQRTAEGDLGTEPMLGRIPRLRLVGEFPTMKKSGGGGGCTFECRFLGFTTWRCPWEVTDRKLVIVSWLSISPI